MLGVHVFSVRWCGTVGGGRWRQCCVEIVMVCARMHSMFWRGCGYGCGHQASFHEGKREKHVDVAKGDRRWLPMGRRVGFRLLTVAYHHALDRPHLLSHTGTQVKRHIVCPPSLPPPARLLPRHCTQAQVIASLPALLPESGSARSSHGDSPDAVMHTPLLTSSSRLKFLCS